MNSSFAEIKRSSQTWKKKKKINPPEPTESETVLLACMAAYVEEWWGRLALKLIPV